MEFDKLKQYFNNDKEFGDIIRERKPMEIWFDVFSTTIPYITVDSYENDRLRGAYTRQCFLTHDLKNVEDIYKEGMYIKLNNPI